MPPRIRPSKPITSILRLKKPHTTSHNYATLQAITPAATPSQISHIPPTPATPPTKPPSLKPPEFLKSQLLRQYTSLLRSTPLMLLFQHNSIRATEWAALRRELTKALKKTDSTNTTDNYASTVNLQIIQTGIFAAALKIVELGDKVKGEGILDLSSRIHEEVAKNGNGKHPLSPLLSGPLVLLTFPTVSPGHLATALSILSPDKGAFKAPTRRVNPGWHDPAVQGAVHKLLLLGARVEEKVFDGEGVRWVGGIEGGLDGLRARVVGMLGGVSGNLASVLEGASRSLYFTMEGRRGMLEDAEKPTEEVKEEGERGGQGRSEGRAEA